MPRIRIIAVGRLREPHWKEAAALYAKRLQRACTLTETIVKDADASLSRSDRIVCEGERILQHLDGHCLPVCLDEHGESMRSQQFAVFLQGCFDAGKTPCFIIGGVYGLSDAVKSRAAKLLSLSPMTLPHELARVLLLEQLYRADAILHGRPYHHA